MNTITVQGRLTRDAELHFSQSGVAIATFDLASNHGKKNEQGKRKVTFLSVTCFAPYAEPVGALLKGAEVLVSGTIHMDQWNDKDTGAKRSKLKIVANCVAASLADWGNSNDKQDEPMATRAAATTPQPTGNDEFSKTEAPDEFSDIL